VADDVALSRIQQRGLAALMVSRTIEDAANSVGIARRTFERWLSDPGFSAAYRGTARDASRQAISALLAAQLEAVETLRGALHDGTPATQVWAARALLEIGVRVREADTDERLDLLESEVNRWGMTGVVPDSTPWRT
jgi:hypothetical protein